MTSKIRTMILPSATENKFVIYRLSRDGNNTKTLRYFCMDSRTTHRVFLQKVLSCVKSFLYVVVQLLYSRKHRKRVVHS